jgi:UDP-N-acetylmuramoyl-tripeptide--D-alanyl-D-alanine ligase
VNTAVYDVVAAIGGVIVNAEGMPPATSLRPITGCCVDSREDVAGKLFIPLKGPRFDGHDYINAAIEKGAVAVLTERLDISGGGLISGLTNAPCVIIHVESAHQALRDLAEWYRARFDIPAVAITGSSGKTTTKDMIASVMSQSFVTLKTEGNLNNEIGLPLTALRLDDTYEAAVFEMGMNRPGEIRNLSRIIKPHVCVITNIGAAHIEFLGSRENILRAKCEIFEYMRRDGTVILNADDDMMGKIFVTGMNNISYGIRGGDVRAKNIRMAETGQKLDIVFDDTLISDVFVPLPGEHNALNALAAAAVGFALGVNDAGIREGLRAFPLSKNRMEFIRADKFTIINDVYNANPQSMIAALNVLSQTASQNETAGVKPETIAVLGDMFELGEFSRAYHEQTGRYAAQLGINCLITVGEAADFIGREVVNNGGGRAFSFASKEEAESSLPNIANCSRQGCIILVKASRGMHLETIVAKLKELT